MDQDIAANAVPRHAAGPVRGSDRQPGRISLVKLAGIVVAALVVIFGGFEVLERAWLQDADLEMLHTLHILRGVVSSVIIALLVTGYLLTSAPPLLVRAPVHGEREAQAGAAERERQRISFCAWWLVQMRWIAVIIAAVLVFLIVVVVEMLPHVVLAPLVMTLAGLVLFNFMVWLYLRQGRLTRYLLQLQVYVDLAALGVLVHFSGGIENPLYIVALIHVIIGGIILSRGQCFAVAAAASLMTSLVVWGEWAEILDHYTLSIVPHGEEGELHMSHKGSYVASVSTVFVGALFLTAYFVTRLSGQLRADEQRLEALATEAMAEHELLEQALETTSTAVRVLDTKLRLRWANEKWSEWFGDLAHAMRTDGAELSAAQETLKDGKARANEIAPGGRFYRVITAPILDGRGEIREVVELAQDVTHQKAEQAKMMRAGQLAAVGELASRIAHEVNNPIAIMSAKARLLVSNFGDQVPEKVREDLDKIVDLSDRVANTAQGLLSYSRPSSGAQRVLDVRQLVRQALDLVRQRTGGANIRIKTHMDAEVPMVDGNANELGQVFLNLFLNAVDAMPDGGDLMVSTVTAQAPAHADLDNTKGAPGVRVVVEDTGTGMTKETRDRIFEPFFTTKADKKGTGLGLSICFGLVNGHGGVIDVDSKPGQGTRFEIWLPPAQGDR